MRWPVVAMALCVAGAAPGFERTEARAPCAASTALRRPFFGDLHVHTALSFDALGQGTRNRPADAYRFARGAPLGIQPYEPGGEPRRTVRLARPLDFAAVTDHAELLGETHMCTTPGMVGYGSVVCRLTRRWPWLAYMVINSQVYDEPSPSRYRFCGEGGGRCLEAATLPWGEIREAAEAAYDRSAACAFTSFVGYEWSGNPDGYMVHRNVIFRTADVPSRPAAFTEHPTASALWDALERDCLDAGGQCDVLTIPHNSNLSGGLLFESPTSREDAMRRSRLDVLLEVIQHKGASECLPGRATSDEACGFEVLPYGRMRESAARWMRTPPPERTYARDVLALGLAEEARLGVNPFRLGFIGSTDTHLGTPGLVEEAAFVGHAAGPVTHRTAIPALPDHVEMNPGGLAVLWAEENSRDALFEAMRRREAYATSGTRPVVRFFAGYDWDEDPCGRDDLVQRGYAEGVPMGGHLRPPGHHRRRPRFVVWASQDAGTPDRPGTALERIEIVKLWLEGGAVRTRVVTVAGAAAPGAPDPDTCAPAPGGALELCTRWQDDAFDAAAPALYYARVLERPSCRWLAYACQAARVDCDGRVPGELAVCCDPLVPTSVRERAWTSPIWYVPPAQR